MFRALDPVKQGQLKGAKHSSYTRIEESIQILGEMICLVVRNLSDQEILFAFNKLKLSCVMHAFASDQTNDEVCEYIKWLGKACQACLLGIKIPEEPESAFGLWEGESLLPFKGELSYISEMIYSGKRTTMLNHKQAMQLAQIGNLPRALPYPSKNQVVQSVKETLDLVQTRTETPVEALKLYRRGLAALRQSIPKPSVKRSHVSLLGSGSVENPRSLGGRARHIVAHARATTDLLLKDCENLVGKFDQFGFVILNKITFDMAIELSQKNNWEPKLGTLMYVPGYLVEEVLNEYFIEGRKVPRNLGHILNLTASNMIRQIGEYEPAPLEICNTIAFEAKGCKFKQIKPLYVKADVSIEAGMKARLTTSALAGFAHLSQLPANYMREYLSKDPFHRVGFEEADKLWEVLKYYRKSKTNES